MEIRKDEEDAQTAALQEYFDSNTPAGYGASFRAGWNAGQDYEARHCPQEGRIVVLKAEVERLNTLVETLSRALQRYQDEEAEAYGGDDPVDHPYQRRGSWSGDDWCAVEGCTSRPSAHQEA